MVGVCGPGAAGLSGAERLGGVQTGSGLRTGGVLASCDACCTHQNRTGVEIPTFAAT